MIFLWITTLVFWTVLILAGAWLISWARHT